METARLGCSSERTCNNDVRWAGLTRGCPDRQTWPPVRGAEGIIEARCLTADSNRRAIESKAIKRHQRLAGVGSGRESWKPKAGP